MYQFFTNDLVEISLDCELYTSAAGDLTVRLGTPPYSVRSEKGTICLVLEVVVDDEEVMILHPIHGIGWICNEFIRKCCQD